MKAWSRQGRGTGTPEGNPPWTGRRARSRPRGCDLRRRTPERKMDSKIHRNEKNSGARKKGGRSCYGR